MNKRLENYKTEIMQILDERNHRYVEKQTMKIELLKREDLADLFSMISYSSDSKMMDIRSKLSGRFPIDEEIENLNEKLLNIVLELKKYKSSCLQEMSVLEKNRGKKVVITKGDKKVKIAEKSAKRYSSIYNTVESIDELMNFVHVSKEEKPTFEYAIDASDVKDLSNEDTMKYYASLAGLIMCEDVTNPKEIDINRTVVVNEKDASTLLECYKGYRKARRAFRKEGKIKRFKNKMKKAVSKVKNFVGSLFGRRAESEVSMALRKSFLAAATAGVMASVISNPQDGAVLNKGVQKEYVAMNNFSFGSNIFNLDNFVLKTNDSSTRVIVDGANTNEFAKNAVLENNDENVLKTMAIDTVSIASVGGTMNHFKENNVLPLEATVPENAYEIVKVSQEEEDTQNAQTEVKEETSMGLADEHTEVVELVAENVTVPSQTIPLVVTPENEAALEVAQVAEAEESSVVESIEIGNDLIVPGYHLTFGNTIYQFSMEELKYLYYVANHEFNGTYQDAMGVISVVANRLEDPRYPSDLISVLSAEGQFVAWDEVLAEVAKYGDDFMMNVNVANALNDVLNRGIRNCDYVEWKASWTGDYSITGELKCQLVEDGNKFHNLAVRLDRTERAKNEEEIQQEGSENTQEQEKGKILELTL